MVTVLSLRLDASLTVAFWKQLSLSRNIQLEIREAALIVIFQSHRRVPLSRRTGGRGRATPQNAFCAGLGITGIHVRSS
jgi:hypothetical protein